MLRHTVTLQNENEQIMRNEQVTIFDISEKQNDDDIGTAFDENNGNDDNDDRNA